MLLKKLYFNNYFSRFLGYGGKQYELRTATAVQVKVENVQKPHQVFVWKQQQLHAEVITK